MLWAQEDTNVLRVVVWPKRDEHEQQWRASISNFTYVLCKATCSQLCYWIRCKQYGYPWLAIGSGLSTSIDVV